MQSSSSGSVVTKNSSSSQRSSSSATPQCGGVEYDPVTQRCVKRVIETYETFTDVRDNKTYKITTIGTQIWMAENLNYQATDGSWCYGESSDGSNNVRVENNSSLISLSSTHIANNCKNYGRLYDWNAAIAACPAGWHLPTLDEWEVLIAYLGGVSVAGGRLKAESGYGFNALFGGTRNTYGVFSFMGSTGLGVLWTSTEESSEGAYDYTFSNSADTYAVSSPKNSAASVRCINDNTLSSSSSSVVENFTDTRDNQTYKSVKIGSQTWMANNLNYAAASGSWCYENQESNCDIYGRLYSWSIAMDLAGSCNSADCKDQIQVPHQGICPAGWHIPNDDEWATLIDFVGENAEQLKSVSAWGYGNKSVDVYGFNALPSGYRSSSDGHFSSVGGTAQWWAPTDREKDAASWYIDKETNDIKTSFPSKTIGFPVRCIKNE